MDDTEINALVRRLSRPHPPGAVVIETAAIMAAGADSGAVIDWILAHSGTPETAASTSRKRGLHGAQMDADAANAPGKPVRFVLPADTLS